MHRKFSLSLVFPGATFLAALSVARACGPDFPNAYLSNSLDEITTLPSLDFEAEVARIYPVTAAASVTAEPELAAETAEVREALVKAGLATEKVDALLANYRRDSLPEHLPAEFHLYARGAKAWHEGNPDEAVAAWKQLLALPEDQRHYRTVWAAYMVGRATADRDPATARRACHLAQQSSTGGFADSQQLGVASLGWEARTYLIAGDYRNALKLYAREFQAGGPSALASLQFTLQRAFAGARSDPGDLPQPEAGFPTMPPKIGAASAKQWKQIASDPQLRGLVAAWFVARGGPHRPWSNLEAGDFKRWIVVLGGVRDLKSDEADRWCWAAYQNGLWDDAAHLAARAAADAPAAEWVRAMLQLRTGSVEEAATHLANASRAFPTDPTAGPLSMQASAEDITESSSERLGGIRGTLALRREQFAEALRLFVRSGHWTDAAFVAERVLKTDELVAFVRAEFPEKPAWSLTTERNWAHPDLTQAAASLRYLLARRLVRENRGDEAREYFPENLRCSCDAYLASVRKGFDVACPPAERAAAFWRGAQIARQEGMELLATELEPDFAIWDGTFAWPSLGQMREGGDEWTETTQQASWRQSAGVLAPTENENGRVASHPIPSHRYHYRHRAAELAWLGALLLPNDDPTAALMLNTAGRWIAARDPEQADLFYKTLVLRCPNTDLGRRAAAKHWLVEPD